MVEHHPTTLSTLGPGTNPNSADINNNVPNFVTADINKNMNNLVPNSAVVPADDNDDDASSMRSGDSRSSDSSDFEGRLDEFESELRRDAQFQDPNAEDGKDPNAEDGTN
jgi:hypothetical protein